MSDYETISKNLDDIKALTPYVAERLPLNEEWHEFRVAVRRQGGKFDFSDPQLTSIKDKYEQP